MSAQPIPKLATDSLTNDQQPTLRQYYAAHALTGLLAVMPSNAKTIAAYSDTKDAYDVMADWAWRYADAMIKMEDKQ